MSTNKSTYDDFAIEYKDTRDYPIVKYVCKHTLFVLWNDLKDKKALDFGCGEGTFSRAMKNLGADEVIGIDISKEMIKLAKENEETNPIGCKYICYDLLLYEPQKKDHYDIVSAVFLLNYAQTREELKKFVETAYASLKPGGVFVGINNNPDQDPKTFPLTKKYGWDKSISKPLREGDPIKITYYNLEGKYLLSFNNYYLSTKTHKEVFEEVGFKDFNWTGLYLNPNPEIKQNLPTGYFDDFLRYCPATGFRATK